MLDMDPPPHNALRAIVNRDFTPRAVRTFTERIRELFDRVLDEALEKGEVEFVDDVAAKLPMRVFAEMLGAPEADHRYLVEIGDRMLGQDDPEFAIDPEVAEANRHLPFSNPAALEMFEYGRKLAGERRECPRDDIVTKLVEAEIDGRPLTQHEYDVYFLLLAVAGNETTRHSISQGVLALIEYPDQLQRLRDDPELLPLAAAEILRWATPVHHFRRTATCDVEFGGKTDPRERQARHLVHLGQLRRGGLRLTPYEFDVGRDPNPQMTFGPGGPHFCTGAHLARLEIEIVFDRDGQARGELRARRRRRSGCSRTSSTASSGCRCGSLPPERRPELAQRLEGEVDVLRAGPEVDEADAQAERSRRRPPRRGRPGRPPAPQRRAPCCARRGP